MAQPNNGAHAGSPVTAVGELNGNLHTEQELHVSRLTPSNLSLQHRAIRM